MKNKILDWLWVIQICIVSCWRIVWSGVHVVGILICWVADLMSYGVSEANERAKYNWLGFN